ncbi:MAG TPA: carboxypeptidase-like regulatory domain-containing protein, partial [Vicinamibacterales bacterium]
MSRLGAGGVLRAMLANAPVLVLHCALATILLAVLPSSQTSFFGARGAPPPATGLKALLEPQALLPGSQASSSTATITGVVVDGTTNAPIAGGVVSLSRGREPVGPQPRQFTDAKGRFAFTNLPAGDGYVLAASKFGYFDGVYGRDAASNAGGGILSLTDGQWVADARIVLWRPAAVGGTVTDELGEPVVGVYVRVLAERWVAGQTRLVAGPSTLTDDRGRYRIPGLRPGRFLVSLPSVQWAVPATMTAAAIAGFSERVPATREVPVESALDLVPGTRLILGSFPVPPPSIDGRPATYPIMFHPAATAVADATFVELKYAEERDGVDIRLEPVASARVAGKVQGSSDALTNLTLRLLPAGLEELGLGSEAATTIVSPDGSFVFLNVAAGSYVIDVMRGLSEFLERPGAGTASETTRQAFPPNPPGSTGSGWSSSAVPSGPNGLVYMTRSSFTAGRFENARAMTGRASVVVAGQDVLDVTVQLRGAASLYGRVIVDEDPRLKSAPPASLPFRAEPANGDPRLGLPRVEG